MRILFTTVALPGHFFPLVPLAWACRAAGHEVLVLSAADFVPTVLGSGLPAASSGPAERFADLVADDRPSAGLAEQRAAHGRVFGRMAARSLPGTSVVMRTWQPDVVVSERAEFAGPLAAWHLGIPQVELHWGVAALPEYRTAAAKELSVQLAARGLDALPRPAAVLNPWPPSLRLPHAAGHTGIRPLAYNGEARVPDWVLRRRRRPRVCLTLGTVVPRTGRSQVAGSVPDIVAALADLGVEIVIAVDDRIAAGWPPLPPEVRHVGRMPLSPVFAACDAAIHHGGQGTALTAIEAALPQLVLPVFDDQFDNGAAITAAGAGIRLLPTEIAPSAIAAHCEELLARPGYRRAAEVLAAELAGEPTPIEVAENLVGLVAGGIAEAA
ncbi:nucleotide disphospho-sugar-binding domain-containing protein [Amycolatopsis sp. lyj-346]|uniref:nucleotide disphospho-sugar-binding domain-containing protein n=1 Tax=Amycolatopsis sp. lyj-346 TaxID=2789289 RepID=UPI00397D0C90